VKQALTIGCGSKNGVAIIDTLLEKGYTVTNIGNSLHPKANNIQIDWDNLQITNLHKLLNISGVLDFVFFNQNSSSLELNAFDFSNIETLAVWKLLKNWQHSHWIACQMPFLLIHNLKHNLTNKSKIGWMLSSTMIWDQPGVENYPDYSSQKYFNYLAMKCFNTHYETFGVMPDFSMADSAQQTSKIIETVCDQNVNNMIFRFQKTME
jgi:hypothetical protein